MTVWPTASEVGCQGRPREKVLAWAELEILLPVIRMPYFLAEVVFGAVR